MQLTNDQSKIDIVSRLVADGAIDFNQAFKLLEVETKIEFMPSPYVQTLYPTDITVNPHIGMPNDFVVTYPVSTGVPFTLTAN